MAKSVFNKKISPACAYCLYGNNSEYTNEIFCTKRGVTHKQDSCRHYKYDVLKRIPNRLKPSKDFKPEDFQI